MGKPLRNPEKSNVRPYLWLLLAGALMIAPVGLAGIGVAGLASDAGSAFGRNFTVAFLGSSLPEEIVRFAVLYIFALRWIGFTRPRDGLIFGAVVSFGFSSAENLLYGLTLGWHMALIKLVIATPIHLALGVMMGGLLVIANGAAWPRRGMVFALALSLPIMLHGIYDLVILTAIGQTAPGTSDVARLILPVLCYSIVIGLAICTGRRACKTTPPAGQPSTGSARGVA